MERGAGSGWGFPGVTMAVRGIGRYRGGRG